MTINGYAIVIYFKSVLAGIVTVVVTTALYSAVIYARLQTRLWMYRRASPGDTFYVEIHWHPFTLPSIAVMLLIFLCGAYWMFRRSRG
jgi:hypothetical protein